MRSGRVPAEIPVFVLLLSIFIGSITYRPWLLGALPVVLLVLLASLPFVAGWCWESPDITPAVRRLLRASGVLFALAPGIGCAFLNRRAVSATDVLTFLLLPTAMVYVPFYLGRTLGGFVSTCRRRQ